MSLNYAVEIPHDKNVEPLQGYPSPIKAKATWATTQLASSVITLTDNTTVLEVSAGGGQGVYLRWVRSTETAAGAPFASVISSGLGLANFDHVVTAGQTRRFVVPPDTGPVNSVVGINKQAGLINRVAWITPAPVSSILATEF